MRKLVSKLGEWLFLLKIYFFGQALYTNCGELPKWNFDKIEETKDLKYLVQLSEYGKKCKAPENAEEIWENIREEYALKTQNDKITLYFNLLAEISGMENRIYFAKLILQQLATRGNTMTEAMRKEYINELRALRFYLNESKPFKEEVERLIRQLKTVSTKLEAKTKEAKEFEEKNFKGGETNTTQLKIRIQRALRVEIDLKKTTVLEWLEWINEAIQSNGKK